MDQKLFQYLCNRKQRFVINGKESSYIGINASVPKDLYLDLYSS